MAKITSRWCKAEQLKDFGLELEAYLNVKEACKQAIFQLNLEKLIPQDQLKRKYKHQEYCTDLYTFIKFY